MKKKIALLTSALMILSAFTSCGGDAPQGEGTDETSVSAASVTSSDTTETSETDAPPEDFFGEGYDPFADDYDPYNGNAALAAEHTPETKAETGEEIPETSAAETSENAAAQTKTETSPKKETSVKAEAAPAVQTA